MSDSSILRFAPVAPRDRLRAWDTVDMDGEPLFYVDVLDGNGSIVKQLDYPSREAADRYIARKLRGLR